MLEFSTIENKSQITEIIINGNNSIESINYNNLNNIIGF